MHGIPFFTTKTAPANPVQCTKHVIWNFPVCQFPCKKPVIPC